MTNYTKTTWTNETPYSTPIKYAITDDSAGVVAASATIELVFPATAEGTPVSATNLNHMEQGIYDARYAANHAEAAAQDALVPEHTVGVMLNGAMPLSLTNRAMFRITHALDSASLINVYANCGTDNIAGSSSGAAPTFTIQNGTLDMLSTPLTIDAGEYSSSNAAVPAVIATGGDETVNLGDIVNVEVTVSGTGVTYAYVTLVFQIQ